MFTSSTDRRPRSTGMQIGLGLLAGLVLLLGLSACGGTDADSADNDTSRGQLVVGLTDAEGDFLTYTVDVLSVELTRANGRVVETLPLATRVDFAQYTDLTEFLTAATVPLGRYTAARITVDYSNAQIEVEGATGAAVPVTAIVDGDGDPLTTVTMDVNLSGNPGLVIAPGLVRYLMLDFDLAASHNVAINVDSATITVDPVLIATVEHESPRLHRLRGPLKSVNVADSYYELYIRPFHNRLVHGNDHNGEFRVHTDDSTHFEINGLPYAGSDGLEILATQPEYTAVLAYGSVRLNPLRFEANEVYAGSSVPGGDLDVVKGSVVARSGDVITVKGATLIRADGTVVFNDSVAVTLADSTTVTKQFSTAPHDIDDISVGQRIVVFGNVTSDSVDDLEFTAANGYARMELSQVRGSVSAVPGASVDYLTLNLTAINGRNPALYDFAGTQASAGSYEIDTGTLALTAIGNGDDVSVRGFPVRYGTGPADYTAQTVIDNSTVIH